MQLFPAWDPTPSAVYEAYLAECDQLLLPK